MDPAVLLTKAMEAQQYAYAPYSHFQVGAALLCEDGSIYTGCNVENASYSASNCAERTAIFKAVSEGKRKFKALAIVGNLEKEEENRQLCMPCGICRQVISEFAEGEFPVYIGKTPTEYEKYTLDDLLPFRFSEKNLFSF